MPNMLCLNSWTAAHHDAPIRHNQALGIMLGMPDDYTLIPYRGKPAADGPRYRAIGNSMAVPVMRWIGRRIQMVDGIRG